MSTRSFICVQDDVPGFRGIYCHYDGYPAHVGRLLDGYHNSIEAAHAIIHGPQIRNFDQDGTIARFGVDAPDESEGFLSIEDALNSGYDYAYLFEDGCWKCFGRDSGIYPRIIREFDIPGRQHKATKEAA